MTFQVRRLTADDGPLLDAAAGLFGRGTATGARFLAQPASIAFVALAEDEIVGWAWGFRQVRPDGRDQVLLYQLDTAQTWRRRGVGTALVRAFLDLAAAEGFIRVWLVTNTGNADAVSVYRALGGQAYQDDDVVYRWEVAPASSPSPES